MWQVILFLAVTVGAYFILRSVAAGQPVEAEEEPRRAETAKEWVEREHGIVFNDERRQRSGLPPLAEYRQSLAETKVARDTEEEGEGDDEQFFDAWRASLTEVDLPGAVGAKLVIRYRDDPTARPIRVLSLLQGDHAHYLQSFCGLRDDFRMFRVESIAEVVDANGEVFAGGYEWLGSLTGHS